MLFPEFFPNIILDSHLKNLLWPGTAYRKLCLMQLLPLVLGQAVPLRYVPRNTISSGTASIPQIVGVKSGQKFCVREGSFYE